MNMKLRLGFSILVLLTGITTRGWAQLDSAQQALELIALAKDTEKFNPNGALTQLREMYAQAVNFDPNNIEANFEAGLLYLRTDNRDKAVPYLERVKTINPAHKTDLFFDLGRAHQYAGNFEQAIEYYENFIQQLVESPVNLSSSTSAGKVEQHINECRSGIELYANPIDYDIQNVGNSINSEWPDYAPALDRRESLMVFTSRRQSGNINQNVYSDLFFYEEIFFSDRNGSSWDYPSNIGEIVNTRYHDSNLALSSSGDTLFLYSDDNNGDIYFSERQPDGGWSQPLPVPGINSSYKENSVSISPDGNILFFSSDRPGHEGSSPNMDIYYAKKLSSGNWGRPRTLGPAVNTSENEEGPFIDYDGVTLYFSSSGWNTMGEHDIFKTYFDSAAGDWTQPVNMGYPLNSPDDDIYFVTTPDGKRGYYASVREEGYGYLDIYEVKIPDYIQEMRDVDPLTHDYHNFSSQEQPDDLNGDRIQEVELAGNPVLNPEDTTPENGDDPNGTGENGNGQPDNAATAGLQPIIVSMKIVDEGTQEPFPAEPVLTLFEPAGNGALPYSNPQPGIFMWEISPDMPDAGQYQLAITSDGYRPSQFRFGLESFTTQVQEVKRLISLRPDAGEPVATNTTPEGDNGNTPEGSNPNARNGNTNGNTSEANSNLRGIVVTYRVRDASTGRPLDADVKLSTTGQSQPIPFEKIGEGEYQWSIDPAVGDGELFLNVVAKDFTLESRRLNLPDFTSQVQRVNRYIDLSPIRIGESNVLQYIFFEFNKATFTQESFFQLDAMKEYMQSNNVSIVLAGHTDNIGTTTFNKSLSEQRAKAVQDYLVKNGINPTRLSFIGFGETKPLVSNDDEEEGREINRRVEFTVVESTARNN